MSENEEKTMQPEKAAMSAPVHAVVITPGPWQVCGASDKNCPCGLIWSTAADCVVATSVSRDNESVTCGEGVDREQANRNGLAIASVPELLELVARSYRALHREEWEDGETESELSDRINDVMCNHFGNDWLGN